MSWRATIGLVAVLITAVLGAVVLDDDAAARVLGRTTIPIRGPSLDLDTRPDLPGVQNTMTAVKGYPTAVLPVLGVPGEPLPQALPPGAVVKADLTGPGLTEVYPLAAPPGELMEIPALNVSGDYALFNVRLEDAAGNVLLVRDPAGSPVVITVIEKLLVTQVNSRALTLDEIREKGIVIDEENFTAVNFTVGLTLGSEEVAIDLPVIVPRTTQAAATIEPPRMIAPARLQRAFDRINIPNFSLAGFQLKVPPKLQEEAGIELPPINGVIVIPGNIGFLHQFFSVILQASNVAPTGSGLTLRGAKATVVLPPGDDKILGSGDDPLDMAETRDAGVQTELPLLGPNGGDEIVPQATNQAEFLVEGLREGTHRLHFDITGDLYVPSLGKTLPLTGKAAGLVQVKNPTFSIVLAHPDVVREGEAYSLFATVTNTSSTPANLFRLALNGRSLTGAKLAEGEEPEKSLEQLAPGQAETVEFKMVARTTGEVTGTVFLADPSINGSFVLTTGVGDTGIPLSPDTLVLPDTVDYLPDDPDVVFQAVRLLGQAYSVATAPAGKLPTEIGRIGKSYVFDRAVKLAQAGLHMRFGETPQAAARDILMDYLGSRPLAPAPKGAAAGNADVDALTDDPALRQAAAAALAEKRKAAEAEIDAAQAERDRRAFDDLRRAADAGHDFTDVVAQLVGADVAMTGIARLQMDWAEAFASRAPHLSFVADSEGAPLFLRLAAGEQVLGRRGADEDMARDVPYADELALLEEEGRHARMIVAAAPSAETHVLEWTLADAAGLDLAVVLPADDDPTRMVQVTYDHLDLAGPASGRMTWMAGGDNDYRFEVDSDGDGAVDRVIEPRKVTAVTDRPPRLLGVQQWAKGAEPSIAPSFEYGDPLGRMVGVFFSEEVTAASATEAANYTAAGNEVLQVALQPDQRLAFLILDRPVGPFVPRSLEVSNVADLRDNAMTGAKATIADAPERGVGGHYTGQVVTAAGEPVPFASVKYIQPVSKPSLMGGCLGSLEVEDYVISTYTADADGRFGIDYVLQSGFPTPDCPSNPDVWLNENKPGSTVNFKLEALDPETGEVGKASSRIHYDGQHLAFDVIIRGYGAIDGKVVREDGEPVQPGAPDSADALYVYASNISTGERYRTWVDETGAYAFPNKLELSNGETLEAPKVTVGNVVLNVIRPSDGHTAVTTVNLPAAGTTTTQDLMMMPPNHFGRVSGRVLEADGERGAPNVLVQIAGRVLTGVSIYERTYGHGVIGSTHTDAEGRFEFERVPTGDIEVRAFRQETYEQVAAKSVLQAEGEQNVTLLFPGSGGTVHGLVRDAFGQPVPHAKVAGGPTETEADAKGFFTIERLPLGRHRIYAQAPDAPALGKVEVQTLGPGDVQNVVVTLEPTGSIAGTVYRADGKTPAKGQKVQLWVEPDRGVMAEATADAEGRFAFEGYPVGAYSVRAVAADHGDGGMAFTAIRFAGDRRDADIVFRGLGSIAGRVVQSNGTPALTDVIVTRKAWRIIKEEGTELQQAYREVIATVKEQSDERTAKQIDKMMQETGAAASGAEFFMLVDESKLLKSDASGPKGEVTGRFRLDRVLAGPFTVAAFGPFLAPAEVSGEVPAQAPAAARSVDVGDVVLTPATGEVSGTVYLPDGKTPVGAGVTVRLRSLDSSGSVMTARGGVQQPVLPEMSVETDERGHYAFPLVLRGRVVLSADSGVPAGAVAARDGAAIDPNRFADEDGKRVLNVRLYAQAGGVVPAGEALDLDMRLANAAAVRVKVVEADGRTAVPQAEVSLRTRSVLDMDEEEGFQRLVADANGEIELFPVIEGAFSVGARLPGTPARGRAAGTIPEHTPAGHQVAVTVQLGAVTTAEGEVIPAKAFGTVEGVVLRADGKPLDNPAQVTVSSGGLRLLATTTEGGKFQVPDVPVGALVVEAFEPFTARRGRVEAGLARDGETKTVELKLVGLGTVGGTILSSDGETPLGRVDVLLYPSGRFSDKLVTRSDPRGRYALPGVPVGPYAVRIKDTESGLAGETRGLMRRDGQRLTTDVRLEPSGSFTGTVYAAGVRLDDEGRPVDAEGNVLAKPPVVANAAVTLRGPRGTRTVQTGADGVYRSGPHLPLGRYRIAVRTADGKDGADAVAELTYDGEDHAQPFVLAGSGTIEGVVLDSVGATPVATAEVRLRSTSPYLRGEVSRFTEQDGSFRFDDVPVGRFSLSVRRTVGETELGATSAGEITEHGQVLALAGDAGLRLQPSASVLGRVKDADGKTPAAGVILVLQGGRLSLGRRTEADGVFRFDGVPLGDYRLDLREPEHNAVAQRAVRLATNGAAVDLGDIVLDDEPPRLVASEPGADANDVAPSTPLTLTFSEPVEAKSVNTETVRATIDGVAVAGKVTVGEDGKTVTFRPDKPWPDLRLVRVEVRGARLDANGRVVDPGIRDLAGRSLTRDELFAFTTADATPPTLVRASPADEATAVPPRSVVRLEFSEPVDPASITNFAVLTDGKPVDGRRNEQPIMGGRVLVFTPLAPLRPDTRHEVVLTGPLRDLAGNAMPEATLRLAFRTLDTRPPRITALGVPPGISTTEGRTVPLQPSFADPDDVAVVEFYIGDELVGEAREAPFAYPLTLKGAAGDKVVVGAVAIDAAGNRGVPVASTLTLVANQPPTVEVVPPADNLISAGETARVVVKVADDVGLAQVSLTADGGELARLAAKLDGPETVAHAFALRIPPETPAGKRVTLQAFVEDTLGLVAQSAPVVVAVVDRFPPLVRIVEPVDQSGLDPGAEVTVRVQATDSSGLKEITLFATGAVTAEERRPIESDGTEVEATFSLRVPSDATAHEALSLTAQAVDRMGNRGTREIRLPINDLLPPKVVLATTSGVAAAEPGRRSDIVVTATDEIGLRDVGLHIDGLVDETRRLEPAGESKQRFAVTLPPEMPLGEKLSVVATAHDRQGNEGSATLELEARDLTGPAVDIEAPKDPKPGTSLAIKVTAKDRYGVAAIDLVAEGAGAAKASHAVEPPTAQTEATFQVAVPANAESRAGIKLRAVARDAAGNQSREFVRWVYVADIVPPTVSEVVPADGAADVAIETPITASFSEAIAPNSVTPESMILTGPEGPVAGKFRFSYDRRHVGFVANAPLTHESKYKLELTTAITDAAGNGLAAPVVSHFVTLRADTTGPAVASFEPGENATGVPMRTTLRVAFNEPLSRKTVRGEAVALRDPQGTLAPFRISLSDDRTTLAIVPTVPLVSGTAYTLALAATMTDEAGNGITGRDGQRRDAVELKFTTAALEIARPSLSEGVLEHGIVDLEVVEGPGMAVDKVEVEVLGRWLPVVGARPFRARFLAPAATAGPDVAVTLVGIDADGDEVARQVVRIPVKVALRGPALLGVPPGASGRLVLRLSKPLAADLAIKIAVDDASVLRPTETDVVLTAGARDVVVPLEGLKEGRAIVTATSSRGQVATIVAVSPATAGRETTVASQPALSVLRPVAFAAALWIPSTGRFEVALPLPTAPTSQARSLSVASTAPDIVEAPADATVAAGARSVRLTLTAHAEGTAALRIKDGDGTHVVSVGVGYLPPAGLPAVAAMAAGVAVQANPLLRPVVLSKAGDHAVRVPLLEKPAAAPIRFAVSNATPDVVQAPGTVEVAAGDVAADLPLTSRSTGHGRLVLTSEARVVELPVVIGDGAVPLSTTTMPVVAVAPAPFDARLHIVRPGRYRLGVPLLTAAAEGAVTVALTSDDSAVLAVPDSTEIAAGATVASVDVEVKQAGTTALVLRAAGLTQRVAVAVGAEAPDAPTGRLASAAGVSVSPLPSLGSVEFMQPGSATLQLPLPPVSGNGIEVTSDDPAIAEAEGPAQVVAGTKMATLKVVGRAPGRTWLRLAIDDVVYLLEVAVGPDAAPPASGAASPSPQVVLRPAGVLGVVALAPNARRSVRLPLRGGVDGSAKVVSQQPALVTATGKVVGSGDAAVLEIALQAAGEPGEAIVDVAAGDLVGTLRVVVGGLEPASQLTVRAPSVGVDIED